MKTPSLSINNTQIADVKNIQFKYSEPFPYINNDIKQGSLHITGNLENCDILKNATFIASTETQMFDIYIGKEKLGVLTYATVLGDTLHGNIQISEEMLNKYFVKKK